MLFCQEILGKSSKKEEFPVYTVKVLDP